jgi:GAF domain-containing protein
VNRPGPAERIAHALSLTQQALLQIDASQLDLQDPERAPVLRAAVRTMSYLRLARDSIRYMSDMLHAESHHEPEDAA